MNFGTVFLLLWTWLPYVACKGIVLYGKGKVVTAASKKSTSSVSPSAPYRSADDSSSTDTDDTGFQFALFTPTNRLGTPSKDFENFTRQAIGARMVGHDQRRSYYFMQDKRQYEKTWMSDSNLCIAEAKAWQLHPNGGFLFADSEQRVTVYFVCDQYCCGTRCCDLNVIFLICMIFFIMLAMWIVIWGCYRYGRAHCRRPTKDPTDEEDDDFVDAQEYLPQTPSLQMSMPGEPSIDRLRKISMARTVLMSSPSVPFDPYHPNRGDIPL